MTDISIFEAGPLEAGQTCPCCQQAIQVGEPIGRCPACAHSQHQACWESAGACRSYECLPHGGAATEDLKPELVITPEDIARGPSGTPFRMVSPEAYPPGLRGPGAVWPEVTGPKRLSALALVSFGLGLLAVVAVGLPGLLAIVLGAIAIGGINARRDLKGAPFAAAGIIIGTLAVVGWTAVVILYLMHRERQARPDLPVSPPVAEYFEAEDLADLSGPIRRAIRANVEITARSGTAGAEGSGVVMGMKGEQVFVLTNRHVIAAADDGGAAGGGGRIHVTFFDGEQSPASIAWRGPPGVDAAVLTCRRGGGVLDVALVRIAPRLRIGETVFAIGNPFGLGWSYSSGVISALRKQSHMVGSLRMIQCQLPLNPGNSGGGLYDQSGALIGINSQTLDKRTTEGIGFAIAVADLVPLIETQAGLPVKRSGSTTTTSPANQP